MNLPLEAYIYIATDLSAKGDLASLCRVSKGFRNAAERILYNTIHMRGVTRTQKICRSLTGSPHLAALVDAVSINVSTSDSGSNTSETPRSDEYWDLIAHAFRRMRRLRFLNVCIDDSADMTHAWVLDGCNFQLRTFHSDFSWDKHLVEFLNTQYSLTDLYILDFRNDTRNCAISLTTQSLPKLLILECTFMEAATTLANNRSLSRLKTCFSASDVQGKRLELMALMKSLRRSRRSLRALDIADSVYSSDFSLYVLARVNDFLSSPYLRYLGTLTLPVDGREVEYYFYLIISSPTKRGLFPSLSASNSMAYSCVYPAYNA